MFINTEVGQVNIKFRIKIIVPIFYNISISYNLTKNLQLMFEFSKHFCCCCTDGMLEEAATFPVFIEGGTGIFIR